MEHKSDVDINCNWPARYSYQRVGTVILELGNLGTSENHPNYSINKIDKNTENSPGDLRKLAVTQTPVENHLVTLAWKTIKRLIIKMIIIIIIIIIYSLRVFHCGSPCPSSRV